LICGKRLTKSICCNERIDAAFQGGVLKLTAVGANALAEDRTDNRIDILTNIIYFSYDIQVEYCGLMNSIATLGNRKKLEEFLIFFLVHPPNPMKSPGLSVSGYSSLSRIYSSLLIIT
jgi:hypothetical protein